MRSPTCTPTEVRRRRLGRLPDCCHPVPDARRGAASCLHSHRNAGVGRAHMVLRGRLPRHGASRDAGAATPSPRRVPPATGGWEICPLWQTASSASSLEIRSTPEEAVEVPRAHTGSRGVPVNSENPSSFIRATKPRACSELIGREMALALPSASQRAITAFASCSMSATRCSSPTGCQPPSVPAFNIIAGIAIPT